MIYERLLVQLENIPYLPFVFHPLPGVAAETVSHGLAWPRLALLMMLDVSVGLPNSLIRNTRKGHDALPYSSWASILQPEHLLVWPYLTPLLRE